MFLEICCEDVKQIIFFLNVYFDIIMKIILK